MAGDQSWVAGVELVAAVEPPSVGPKPGGVDLRVPTAANRTCYLLMNHADSNPRHPACKAGIRL